jgi:acetylglutamate kinase
MTETYSHTLRTVETLKYVKKFCGRTFMIKLGGSALENMELVARLCADLSLVRSASVQVVIVHGGGPNINRQLEMNNIRWDFIDGLRVTTPQMMDIIEMVLCGKVNPNLVRTINATGVSAMGITGIDNCTLLCEPLRDELIRVGRIKHVNVELISDQLRKQQESGKGSIPVIAPIGVDEQGLAYNINADFAASHIACALEVDKLIYLTDQEGILDKDQNLITEINENGLRELVETGVVSGGMLAKVKAVIEALAGGVREVHILNGTRSHSLIQELYTDKGVGTLCRQN